MQTRQHNALTYGLELWVIRLRDLFRPPKQVLIEAGVRAGVTVLDFGCGPGGFSLAAAKIAVAELGYRRGVFSASCQQAVVVSLPEGGSFDVKEGL